jgi:hypothetical protein
MAGPQAGAIEDDREALNQPPPETLPRAILRLVGKYINLSNPAITRPWIGLIVSERRIDGRWPQGRLDFRR